MLAKEIETDFIYEELIDVKNLEFYDQHLCAYVASVLEKKVVPNILTRSRSVCQECANVFNKNPRIYNSFVAKKNQKTPCVQPCSSTMDIVVAGHTVFQRLESHGYVEYNSAAKTLFNNLDIDSLYCSSDFDTHQNQDNGLHALTHKEDFVSNVVQEYLNMKSIKIDYNKMDVLVQLTLFCSKRFYTNANIFDEFLIGF